MLERGKLERGILEIVGTQSLAPKGHLRRKIDTSVDCNRIYKWQRHCIAKTKDGQP